MCVAGRGDHGQESPALFGQSVDLAVVIATVGGDPLGSEPDEGILEALLVHDPFPRCLYCRTSAFAWSGHISGNLGTLAEEALRCLVPAPVRPCKFLLRFQGSLSKIYRKVPQIFLETGREIVGVGSGGSRLGA